MVEVEVNDVDFNEDDDVVQEQRDDVKRKGRGFGGKNDDGGKASVFDRLKPAGTKSSGGNGSTSGETPVKSIEGWILIVRNVSEDAERDDLEEKFKEFGVVKHTEFALDRATGFPKGYALVEYADFEAAKAAQEEMDGANVCEQKISVSFAFVKR